MSIGTKMRGVGESTYYTKLLRPQLEEVLNDSNYEMEHILGKRKLVVHTDRISDELSDSINTLLEHESPKNIEVVRYNHNMEISWRDINKYAECVKPKDMYAVDPEKHEKVTTSLGTDYYTSDFASDGQFVYPIPKMERISNGFSASVFKKTTAEVFRISAPAVNWGYRCISEIKSREIYLDAPLCPDFNESYLPQAEVLWCNTTALTSIQYMNVPKLHTIDCDFSKLRHGTNGLQRARLTKESALRILNGIPTWSDGTAHDLLLGIHIDHQNDEEVLAAIANAEAKGWTLTVQWNGTPTAQASVTYGLRKPPIYAKLSEMEMTDGTSERVLEWGHYVTNPEDYQEFSSVEEAKEYFGISEEN